MSDDEVADVLGVAARDIERDINSEQDAAVLTGDAVEPSHGFLARLIAD